MVNHTIHTCEQRVRFPLSAIVIFIHYISTILYSTPHIHKHKPTHIYSPAPKQTTSPLLLYKCVNITLTLTKPKLYLHLLLPYSPLLPYQIYILSYLLLINIYYTTIYIPTYNQIHHYLRYISYIYNYYLLTYTENRTHLSIHLFHPTIVFIQNTLTYIQYILYIPLLLHYYYFIIL